MVAEYMTWDEIQRAYPDEWVLIDKPVDRTRSGELLGGILVMHSPDRTVIERHMLSIQPGQLPLSAFVFTGRMRAWDEKSDCISTEQIA